MNLPNLITLSRIPLMFIIASLMYCDRAGAATAAISLPGISVQGSLTGTAAMAHLVAAWDAASQPGRLCPLMVAFGPAEAEALNTAARAARATAGPAGRPARTLGERSYAVGDEVLVLRRIGPIAGATRGTVVALASGRMHESMAKIARGRLEVAE